MKKKNKSLKRNSFTIIELLVVIAIIGLLASIVLVTFKAAREKSKIAKSLYFSSEVHHVLASSGFNFYEFNGEDLGDLKVTDTSGFGNDGLIVQDGSSTFGLVPGIVGEAILLTGGGNYSGTSIQVPNSANTCKDKITIQVWIKPYNVSLMRTIVAKYKVFYFNIIGGSLEFLVWLEDGTYEYINSGYGVIENNKWYHVAGTYNGSEIKMFINGVEVGKKAISGNKKLMVNNKPIGIGAVDWQMGHNYNFFYFDGIMDEIRVYCEGI